MKVLLSIKNLSIGFKRSIMNNITADLNAHELVAIMGVNGVGKSCLLRTIARLQEPFSGEIELMQKSIFHLSPLELAQRIAIVLTEKIHFDYVTVFELVSFGRTPYTNWQGQLQVNDLEIISESLESVGMSAFSNSYYSELSDGQKQKVLIARALAQQPQILILDEPTTFLDIPSKIELIKCLKRLVDQKKMSVLFSTHDLSLVENVVDRVWLMGADGSFLNEAPQVLRTNGAFKKHFKFEPI